MDKANPVWDRPAIIAELHRRGLTLTGLAEEAGVYSSACRQGILGNSRMGAELIAKALDVPLNELFPGSYTRRRRGTTGDTNRNTSRNGSAKRGNAADKHRGAA